MKKVLVTGATGFLGSHLAHKLKSLGHKVMATGRDIKKAQTLKESDIEFLPLDLSDANDVLELPLDVGWVFHCAALSSPWGRYKDFYSANVQATKNLCAHYEASDLGKFVYVSSPSIYTDFISQLNVSEASSLPKNNLNYYIETKKIAENIVDDFYLKGLPAITIRPQGIIGAGDVSIFPRILRSARKGVLPKIGSGCTHLDLTYVDNVVEALICAASSDPRFNGQKYNITNDEPVELYSTIDGLLAQLGIAFKWRSLSVARALAIASALESVYGWLPKNFEPPLTRYSVCTFAFDRTLDISRAKSDLGYAPKISIEQGLCHVLDHYKGILRG
ncbi:MAG: NAD-dependent epimerase/dehydratase family protein [Bdellovibrionales bacterium]|nr:NAD-dependent epimerase/dehydratase family protein [Bdellovibrionales bacterium]